MGLDVLMLVGGIALLIAGGELLVRGSVVVARVLGVPPLVVGLTIVAFGTSAPELGLNIVAAFNGNPELSFGNVVGSNMANIGLVLGLAALLRPLVIDASVVKRELPMMLGISVLAAVLCAFPIVTLSDGSTRGGSIGVGDAWLLLVAFAAVLFVIVKAGGIIGPDDTDFSKDAAARAKGRAAGRAALVRAGGLVAVGLGALIGGGWLAEGGAVGIAERLGWSEDVIGLTVVAVATSLPELVTSLVAVRRGQVDIAVGNVVGSNIFNLSLVLPVTAFVTPVPTPEGGVLALVVMLVLSVLLVPMARYGPRSNGASLVSRVEGLVLLGVYLGYMAWRVMTLAG